MLDVLRRETVNVRILHDLVQHIEIQEFVTQDGMEQKAYQQREGHCDE
jgi:hypothetical protein